MEIDRLRYELNVIIGILIAVVFSTAFCIYYLRKIKSGMALERFTYDKPTRYGKKVLLGNWVEDQFHYTKDPQPMRTTYRESYTEKIQDSNWNEFVWDQKIKHEGLGGRILIDHGKEAYLDNMSALYDLSYNHFPKWNKGPVHRMWNFGRQTYEPNGDEYIVNYGNLTKYGIMEQKKEEWRCDKQDPRISATTHYQEMFLPPKREDLVTHHFAVPRANNSLAIPGNEQSRILKLRNKYQCSVVPNDQLVQVPERYKCNPLTWECNQPDPPGPRRCVKFD